MAIYHKIRYQKYQIPEIVPVTEYVSKSKAKEPNLSSKTANRLLCKILANKATSPTCKSYYVADVIDLAWAVAPLFSCRGTQADENLYNLHRNFIGYLNAYGIPSITIEAIKLNSNHTYKVARPNMEPYEMQSYFHNCSYLRENLLNVAIRKLKLPWEYIMWIDAHQFFEKPMWIFDAIVLAEKFKVVQLFDFSIRLDPRNETKEIKRGFMCASFSPNFIGGPYPEFGNAMMIRKSVYEEIEYILDDCIANDCDVQFCKAIVPKFEAASEKLSPIYVSQLSEWVNKANNIFNGSRAYLDSKIIHFYHQSKTFPFFELNQLLGWMRYDKNRDIRRDENFAFYIVNNTIAKSLENLILNTGNIEQIRRNSKEKTIEEFKRFIYNVDT